MAFVRPAMMPPEEVAGFPVTIKIGEAARITVLPINRLFVDPRFHNNLLLAVNWGRLMMVVMMLDDLAVDDWRPHVRFSFPVGRPIQVCSQGRTCQAHDGERQEG